MLGTSTIMRQFPSGAAFALVGLDVIFNKSSESHTHTHPSDIDVPEGLWCGESQLAAIHFGIDYAMNALRKEGHLVPPMRVGLREFQWRTVDSSLMVVALAAALAFCDAVGIELACPPKLSKKGEEFVFPYLSSGA